MKLIISVAQYASDSPMWEVIAFWEGKDEDYAATFGSEDSARAFARGLERKFNDIMKDYFE